MCQSIDSNQLTKRKKKTLLTTNGSFPLLNRTELAGQLLLSIPPPIKHLVGLDALLFTGHKQQDEDDTFTINEHTQLYSLIAG